MTSEDGVFTFQYRAEMENTELKFFGDCINEELSTNNAKRQKFIRGAKVEMKSSCVSCRAYL